MPALTPSPGFFPSAHSLINADTSQHFFCLTFSARNVGGSGPGNRCVQFEVDCEFLSGFAGHIWSEPGYVHDIYLDPVACCGEPDATAVYAGAGDPLPGSGVWGNCPFPPEFHTLHGVAKLLNDVVSPRQTYIIRFGKLWCGAAPDWLKHNVTHFSYWP